MLLFCKLPPIAQDVCHTSDMNVSCFVIDIKMSFYQWFRRPPKANPQAHHLDRHIHHFPYPFHCRLQILL